MLPASPVPLFVFLSSFDLESLSSPCSSSPVVPESVGPSDGAPFPPDPDVYLLRRGVLSGFTPNNNQNQVKKVLFTNSDYEITMAENTVNATYYFIKHLKK